MLRRFELGQVSTNIETIGRMPFPRGKVRPPRKGIGFAISLSWTKHDFEVIVGKEN